MNIRNKSLFRSAREVFEETSDQIPSVGEDSAVKNLEVAMGLPGSSLPPQDPQPSPVVPDEPSAKVEIESSELTVPDSTVSSSSPQFEAERGSVVSQRAGLLEGPTVPASDEVSEGPENSTAGALGNGVLYRQCCEFVAESIARAGRNQLPDLELGNCLVDQMQESHEQGTELLSLATDRTQRFDVSTHCVNVTVFVLHMAPALNYSPEIRRRAGLAGLLHEVGVANLAPELLHRRDALTTPELELLRQRPVASGRILRAFGPGWEWLAEVAEQIYEREDGSGYPVGLVGPAIREEAKIIGMADLFEACIHDRPYRRAITGYQAVLELTSKGAQLFPDRIIKALLKSFSLFPHNEFVRLNSGEIGRVVEVNRNNLFRPIVEVAYRPNGEALSEPRVLDLSRSSSLYVTEAIPQENLNQRIVY